MSLAHTLLPRARDGSRSAVILVQASGSDQHDVAARVTPVAAGQVCSMTISADQRLRAEPPLPPAAFGNWSMLLPTVQLDASSVSMCTLAAAVRTEVLAAAPSFYNE